jgi:methylated-DNA-[protein]-cysteine S-methyltransferase
VTDPIKKAARRLGEPREAVMERLMERVAKEADVAYDEVETPFGTYVVATTAKGLVSLSFEHDPDEAIDELARRLSPSVVHAPKRIDRVRRELDEYFEGRRKHFDVPLDWSLVTGFNRKVLEATARIPYGGVSTYADMARSAGSPRAARAAGNALHNNPIPIVVPCHRVLHSGGGLGGYGGGLDMKKRLLTLEGALREG